MEYISKHIKLEFSELITVDNNDKDSLFCELDDSEEKATWSGTTLKLSCTSSGILEFSDCEQNRGSY